MEEIISLVIPFIALSIISVMSDRFTMWLELIMNRIPKLPDKFEGTVSYVIVFLIGYFICWQLDFALFRYFGLEAKVIELDYVLTALIISGGSTLLRTQFGVISDIPSVVQGITSSLKGMIIPSSNKKVEQEYPIQSEQIPLDLLDLQEDEIERRK